MPLLCRAFSNYIIHPPLQFEMAEVFDDEEIKAQKDQYLPGSLC